MATQNAYLTRTTGANPARQLLVFTSEVSRTGSTSRKQIAGRGHRTCSAWAFSGTNQRTTSQLCAGDAAITLRASLRYVVDSLRQLKRRRHDIVA